MPEFSPSPLGAPRPSADSETTVFADGEQPVAADGGRPVSADGGRPVSADRVRARTRRRWRNTIEWVAILVVAFIGAGLIRSFMVQAFYIPSGSMEPTLDIHDRVLVNKLSYHLHPVHRGDIVVFSRSPGFDPHIKDLIKRVIGLPGDTVEGRNGHVYVNGHLLNEPYLEPNGPTTDFGPRVVPAHEYWVMGDNRTDSADSRVFGFISRHQIVGRAFVLIWPLTRIHLF